MFTTTGFLKAFFQLVHSIDCRILFLLVVTSYLGIAMTVMIWKNALGGDRTDTLVGLAIQLIDNYHQSSSRSIDLHKSYQDLVNKSYSQYSELHASSCNIAKANNELLRSYGEVVGLCRELADSHGRIAVINEKIMQDYGQFSKQYGLMAMNFGYALRECAGLSGS